MAGLDKAKVQKLKDLWDACKKAEKDENAHKTAGLTPLIEALGKANDAKSQKKVVEAFNAHLIAIKKGVGIDFQKATLSALSEAYEKDKKKFLAQWGQAAAALVEFRDYYREAVAKDDLGVL